jgi:hypothetical protein
LPHICLRNSFKACTPILGEPHKIYSMFR